MVIFVINECRILRVFSGLLSQIRIDFQLVIEYAGHFIVAFWEMLYFGSKRETIGYGRIIHKSKKCGCIYGSPWK